MAKLFSIIAGESLRTAGQPAGQLQKHNNNIITCQIWELTSSQFFSLLSVNMICKCTSAGADRGKKRRKTTQPRLSKTDWTGAYVCVAYSR